MSRANRQHFKNFFGGLVERTATVVRLHEEGQGIVDIIKHLSDKGCKDVDIIDALKMAKAGQRRVLLGERFMNLGGNQIWTFTEIHSGLIEFGWKNDRIPKYLK